MSGLSALQFNGINVSSTITMPDFARWVAQAMKSLVERIPVGRIGTAEQVWQPVKSVIEYCLIEVDGGTSF
jgi:hypothetical protein